MIYVLEDDANIREFVVYALTSACMDAEGFETPAEFWIRMKAGAPDLLVLDLMLPGEDGISVLKRLRASPETGFLPVILLTAKDTEFDKVTGLDCGADDYVTKPFSMMELMSRIRALLRRTESGEDTLTFGKLTIYPPRHRVEADGKIVALTLKEYELLKFLLENRGGVFTRDQLLSGVWGYSFDGESRTVDVHVRTLRQKLGECGDYIETVRGVGYRMREDAP
ncbi:MAG: response regulator transcription factor [Oscillospiraceae bacterium]|nr:response regulator transcription factor [Oscillospiraceae bacterium]